MEPISKADPSASRKQNQPLLFVCQRNGGDLAACVRRVRFVHLTAGYFATWPSAPARRLTGGHAASDA
jgi:hypothetical protein